MGRYLPIDFYPNKLTRPVDEAFQAQNLVVQCAHSSGVIIITKEVIVVYR